MKNGTDSPAPCLGSLAAFGRKGMYWLRRAPCYGRQDVGLSPGGAMDRFAMHTGNIMLGNADDAEALEFLLPPEIEFLQPVYFILTGGHFRATLSRPGQPAQEVNHAAVAFAPAGATLTLGVRTRGLRGYLCVRPCLTETPEDEFLQRRRGPFAEEFSWFDPFGRIRVIEGPEYAWLSKPELFTRHDWTVSRQASDMGVRLEGETELLTGGDNMISDAVADGTVQLTPKGPIVLLKHRQTVGGYPRVYNVISADVDLLAQFSPGQSLRFRKVSLAEAVTAARQKRAQLEVLRARFALQP